MLIIGYAVLAVVIIATILILGKAVAASVEHNSHPADLLEEVKRPQDDAFLAAIRECDNWANGEGFKPHKLMQMDSGAANIEIATWVNPENARMLLMYFTPKSVAYDIVSQFEEDIMLTTSNSRDSHLLPSPPGNFIQNFVNADLDRLIGEHESAEHYLNNKYNVHKEALSGNIRQDLIDHIETQMQYVKQQALWQLKGAYWFLFRRHFRANTPVKSLYS